MKTYGVSSYSFTYTDMSASKKWYKSKVFWFNLIVLLMGSVQLVSDVYYVPQDVLALVLGIGNLLLRFVTNTKLSR